MVLTPGVGVNQDITSATTGYYLVQDRWVANARILKKSYY